MYTLQRCYSHHPDLSCCTCDFMLAPVADIVMQQQHFIRLQV